MAYTKTQLLNAFCASQGYNPETDGTKAEFLNQWLAERQLEVDAYLARVQRPADLAKEQALNYLLEQEKLSNANVTIL